MIYIVIATVGHQQGQYWGRVVMPTCLWQVPEPGQQMTPTMQKTKFSRQMNYKVDNIHWTGPWIMDVQYLCMWPTTANISRHCLQSPQWLVSRWESSVYLTFHWH